MRVTVRTHYNVHSPEDKLGMVGNCAPLGFWNPDYVVVGVEHPVRSGNWLLTFNRDLEPVNLYFKILVIRGERDHRQVVRWEECGDRLMPLLEYIRCPWNGRAVLDSQAWQFQHSDAVSAVERPLDPVYRPRTECDASGCQRGKLRDTADTAEEVTSYYIDRHAKDTVGMYQTRHAATCKNHAVADSFASTPYITHPLELVKPPEADWDSSSNDTYCQESQETVGATAVRDRNSTISTEEEERWDRVEEVLSNMQSSVQAPDCSTEQDSHTASSISLTRDANAEADFDEFSQLPLDYGKTALQEQYTTKHDASSKLVEPGQRIDATAMTSELIAATKEIIASVLPDPLNPIPELLPGEMLSKCRAANGSPNGISSMLTNFKIGATRNVRDPAHAVSQTVSCGTWPDCCLLDGCQGPRQRRAAANTWMHLHDLLVTDPDEYLERVE